MTVDRKRLRELALVVNRGAAVPKAGIRQVMAGVEHGKCSACEKWFPRTKEHFHAHPETADRLATICKPCARGRARRRYDDPAQRRAKYAAGESRKELARQKTRYAVSKGRLIRPDACSRCGVLGNIHAHHHDYSKPLDVEWLCAECHAQEHVALDAAAAMKAERRDDGRPRCPECDRPFATKQALRSHFGQKHPLAVPLKRRSASGQQEARHA